eukprot:135345-Chlamydomonas_euryale.AAC.3
MRAPMPTRPLAKRAATAAPRRPRGRARAAACRGWWWRSWCGDGTVARLPTAQGTSSQQTTQQIPQGCAALAAMSKGGGVGSDVVGTKDSNARARLMRVGVWGANAHTRTKDLQRVHVRTTPGLAFAAVYTSTSCTRQKIDVDT